MFDSMVGIIANHAAGKDIRRIVSQGRFISNQEKVNTLARVIAGLVAAGVKRVVFMPDIAMLGAAASSKVSGNITTEVEVILELNDE